MTLTRKTPLRRKLLPVKRSTLKNRCDKLWSLSVREGGVCELAHRHFQADEADGGFGFVGFPCSGPLQAAHGFSRRYLGVRYELINGFALCRAAHVYWTHHPLEWDDVLRAEWGSTVYEELRQKALNFKGPLDYRLIADALR